MIRNYGKRIAELREERNQTQEELASLLSRSAQTVMQWEEGYATPTIDDLLNICEAFGITTSFFFGEMGNLAASDENDRSGARPNDAVPQNKKARRSRKKIDGKAILTCTPWGILSGVFSILAFFLTAGITGAFMILDSIAKETHGRATLFQTPWQSTLFAFDVICIAAFAVCVVMFILFEPKKKVVKRSEINESVQ